MTKEDSHTSTNVLSQILNCHAYFETIELAAGEVEKRFAHKDMNTNKEIEEIFLKLVMEKQ